MSMVGIDCYSLNFTKDVHEFVNPLTGRRIRNKLLMPLTPAQRTATLALLATYNPVLHVCEDGRQLYIPLADGGSVYIDAEILKKRGPVHFRIGLRPKATAEMARFVFSFAMASEMALILQALPVTITVASTPIDRLPADWPPPKICEAPKDVLILLKRSFRSAARQLARLRKLWR
jgi:hypothetical protein